MEIDPHINDVVESLRASGLEPIIVDDADDLATQLEGLLRKRETNVEFMTRIMEFCPHGALGQAFVMEALRGYCSLIEEATDEECDSGFMATGTWKRIGKWLQGELDARFAKG